YFFTDYQEPATSKGQVEGRRQQFAAFGFEGEVRDPQDPALFEQSKLHWEKRFTDDYGALLDWHRDLIRLRRTHPLLADLPKHFLRADVVGPSGLSVYRYSADGGRHLVCLFNFSHQDAGTFPLGYTAASNGTWRKVLGSGAETATHAVPLPPQGVAVTSLIFHRDHRRLQQDKRALAGPDGFARLVFPFILRLRVRCVEHLGPLLCIVLRRQLEIDLFEMRVEDQIKAVVADVLVILVHRSQAVAI